MIHGAHIGKFITESIAFPAMAAADQLLHSQALRDAEIGVQNPLYDADASGTEAVGDAIDEMLQVIER